MMSTHSEDKTSTILILFFILVFLLLLLFFLYKRLNHETKDKYTVQQLVFGEGGLRDQVIQGIAIVETRFGNLIRSQTPDEEQALNSEDGKGDKKDDGEVNPGQSHSENENQAEEKDEEHNDSSDDYSSIDLKERIKQNNRTEEEINYEEQEEEQTAKDETKGDDCRDEDDVKKEETIGLLVNLKTFSGSAIWSGEKIEDNVTAL